MRRIKYSTRFRRDFKRELRGRYRKTIEQLLPLVIADLAAGRPLDQCYNDHALAGDKQGLRDCHLKPDLVLIYHRVDGDELRLERLGSHAELKLE